MNGKLDWFNFFGSRQACSSKRCASARTGRRQRVQVRTTWLVQIVLAAIGFQLGLGCAVSRENAVARPWNKPTKYEISQGWWFREVWVNDQRENSFGDLYP